MLRPPKVTDAKFTVIDGPEPPPREHLGWRIYRVTRVAFWVVVITITVINLATNGLLTTTIHKWLFGW